MKLRPISFKDACDYVAKFHRHNKPPTGHKFSIGLVNNIGNLMGVAMVGRPIARALDNGLTAEINRTCTDGTQNANSMLYGAAVRACKAMGYDRVVTYTQADESGASLRAAGFVRVKTLPARKSWLESSGPKSRLRTDAKEVLFEELNLKRDPVGNGGIERVLWEWKRTQWRK